MNPFNDVVRRRADLRAFPHGSEERLPRSKSAASRGVPANRAERARHGRLVRPARERELSRFRLYRASENQLVLYGWLYDLRQGVRRARRSSASAISERWTKPAHARSLTNSRPISSRNSEAIDVGQPHLLRFRPLGAQGNLGDGLTGSNQKQLTLFRSHLDHAGRFSGRHEARFYQFRQRPPRYLCLLDRDRAGCCRFIIRRPR